VKTGYIKVVLPAGAAAQPDLARVLTGNACRMRWRPAMWVLRITCRRVSSSGWGTGKKCLAALHRPGIHQRREEEGAADLCSPPRL
jgi:hypothetical protein